MNFLNFILFGIPGLLFRQNRISKKTLNEQTKIRQLLELQELRTRPPISKATKLFVFFLVCLAFALFLVLIVFLRADG
jgi:hypothetical protein